MSNLDEQNLKVYKVFSQILWKKKDQFFSSLGPKSLLKTQTFEKKGNLSSEETILQFWTMFSPKIECNKPQGTISKWSKT